MKASTILTFLSFQIFGLLSCGDGEGSTRKIVANHNIINSTSHDLNLMVFGDTLQLDTLFNESINSNDSILVQGECLVGWKSPGTCYIGWDETKASFSKIVFDDQKVLNYGNGGCLSKFRIYELSDGTTCIERANDFQFRYEITENDYLNAK